MKTHSQPQQHVIADAKKISVAVQGSDTALADTLQSWAEHETATNLAWGTPRVFNLVAKMQPSHGQTERAWGYLALRPRHNAWTPLRKPPVDSTRRVSTASALAGSALPIFACTTAATGSGMIDAGDVPVCVSRCNRE